MLDQCGSLFHQHSSNELALLRYMYDRNTDSYIDDCVLVCTCTYQLQHIIMYQLACQVNDMHVCMLHSCMQLSEGMQPF